MIKALVACGAGMGTSQMIKDRAVKVFEKHQVEYNIDHTSIEFARKDYQRYDVVIVPQAFTKYFDSNKVVVVGLKNILSAKEIQEKLIEAKVLSPLE
ncbi:MAG: PTS sugar transporter subunit IIB [Erysipelotrichaceae bacterium]|nr:PTS sugar transporter subunit IIB [Erysipelotrichaceae bacterium]